MIEETARGTCKFCRFQRCLAAGMRLSWVRTSHDKTGPDQRRRQKKSDKVGEDVEVFKRCSVMAESFTNEEEAQLLMVRNEFYDLLFGRWHN